MANNKKKLIDALYSCFPMNTACLDSKKFLASAKQVMETFDVAPNEALILAVIMHDSLIAVSQKTASVIGIDEKDVLEGLNGLRDKGFLQPAPGRGAFCVSEMARKRLKSYLEDTVYVESEEKLHELIVGTYAPLLAGKPFNGSTEDMEAAVTGNPEFIFSRGYASLGIASLETPQKLSFFLLCCIFLKEGSVGFDVKEANENTALDGKALKTVLDSLVTLGLAEIQFTDAGRDSSSEGQYNYSLSLKSVKALFRGAISNPSYAEISKYSTIVLHDDIMQKNLYYDEETSRSVEEMKGISGVKEYAALSQKFTAMGLRPSLAMLFYGAPGAGKTELARQLSVATGRDLVVADVSRLSSMWMGASEKRYRAIFRAYRYLVALTDRFPILLFNEADGILSVRTDNVQSYHDSTANRLQNVLLEELEQFEGIFVATTNFASNIDEGFNRRFVSKIHLDRPGAGILAKIWQEKMPDLSPEDASELAARYCFTGAQIDNILSRKIIREQLTGCPATIDDIRAFCAEEQVGFSAKDRKTKGETIGF